MLPRMVVRLLYFPILIDSESEVIMRCSVANTRVLNEEAGGDSVVASNILASRM